MHVSQLTKKFRQFVGETFHLDEGGKPNRSCPYTRKSVNRMTELANMYAAEVIVNDAPPETRARCHVRVDTGQGNKIMAVEAAIIDFDNY